MALRERMLRKKASKFELKGLEKNRIIPECLIPLEEVLNEVYLFLRPKPVDYQSRRDLIFVFNEIANEIYGNSAESPIVEAFGSFSMDIFTRTSDLDLSVNFGRKSPQFSREMTIQAIHKFAKKFDALLRSGHVSSINQVTTAKVPIMKVTDSGTGIECDISIENRDGILKSKLIRVISSIDERFPKLSFLMKAWAKAQGINSSKDRTLNSLSIVLLSAFHLQTRDPPILPPFSVLLKDGTDPSSVGKAVQTFKNYGKKNKESLAGLFLTLLMKLSSVENLWHKGICASSFQGSWISKTWNSKLGFISVEDFTDRSQNVARAVGSSEVKKIYKSIQLSIQHIFAFMGGQIHGQSLRELLFGGVNLPPLAESHMINHVNIPAKLPINPEFVNMRMAQPMERMAMLPSSVLGKRTRPMGKTPDDILERISRKGWGPTPAWERTCMEGPGRGFPQEDWRGGFPSRVALGERHQDANGYYYWSKRIRHTSKEELHADDGFSKDLPPVAHNGSASRIAWGARNIPDHSSPFPLSGNFSRPTFDPLPFHLPLSDREAVGSRNAFPNSHFRH